MANVRDHLNQVWSLFRRVGIADDLAIIEHIAALLLPDNAISMLHDNLRPRMPQHSGLSLKELQQILADAAKQADGVATLFDQHVLFRLPRMLAGGRYPTPRHIVDSMLQLTEVAPTHRLADFACGSGGYLGHWTARDDTRPNQTVGVEISSEWARLAWANTILHGMTTARIELGNALQVCGPGGPLAEAMFDRILMNPPFGEKVDPDLAARALEQKTSSRSETALTALALHKLADDGRAAVLVPSGLLFSNSTGERELRGRLLDEYTLEAVVSLPKDAFQPFSALQTHLLLVCRRTPAAQDRVWLIQVEHDGYPSGRGRDLTEPPGEDSDLPFVEGIFAKRAANYDAMISDGEGAVAGIKKITSGKDQFLGVVIEAIAAATLASIEIFPAVNEPPKTPMFILAGITDVQERRRYIQVLLDSGATYEVEERTALLSQLYKWKESAPSPGTTVFQGSAPAQAVVISADGRLLGATMPRERLRQRSYDLRPDQYVKSLETARQVESPAILLGHMWQNQRQLGKHIDGLLGRLELAPIAAEKLPSPLLTEHDKAIEPFGVFSDAQREVWKRVLKQVERVRNGKTSYLTAKLFTPVEVEAPDAVEASENTLATLDLLERMGVIIPVTIADPNTSELMMFYRRVTERDRWLSDTPSSESGQEDA
jgi:type I restriction enzyme M protein